MTRSVLYHTIQHKWCICFCYRHLKKKNDNNNHDNPNTETPAAFYNVYEIPKEHDYVNETLNAYEDLHVST